MNARKITRIFLGLFIICLVTGVAYGAFAFSQTTQSVIVNGATAGCTTLVASVASIQMNSTGDFAFWCSSTLAAFSAKSKTMTPTFALPGGYTDMFVYPSTNALNSQCSVVTSSFQVISGTPHTFGSSPTSWNYCIDYSTTNQTSIPGFTVSWA